MYRVLLPVDTDEDRALAQAQYVTGLPDASESVAATLLFVFQGEGDELPEELRGFNSATRIGSIRRARKHLEDHGVETRIVEDSGDTVADILDVAEEQDIDAIVLGGRKRSPVGKALFGSVTQSVILETDLPVVVTGDAHE